MLGRTYALLKKTFVQGLQKIICEVVELMHVTVPPFTDRFPVGSANTSIKASWIVLHAHRQVRPSWLLLKLINLFDASLVQPERLHPTIPHAELEFSFVFLQFLNLTPQLFIALEWSVNSYFPVWFRSSIDSIPQLLQGLIPVVCLCRQCSIHISPAHLFHNFRVLVHGARRVQRVLKRSLAGRSCSSAASISCCGSRRGGSIIPLLLFRRRRLIRCLHVWPYNILVFKELIQFINQTGLTPPLQDIPCL